MRATSFPPSPPCSALRIDAFVAPDEGLGRIAQRSVGVFAKIDCLNGARRFTERRLPKVATIIRVKSRVGLADHSRLETRDHISSADVSTERARTSIELRRKTLDGVTLSRPSPGRDITSIWIWSFEMRFSNRGCISIRL
ncbi:hypothetical protein [Methylosinus sp. Ce-a6]|uniref:hypothetical protein n=1 Tax=Methylosinus sp. Ce-a6 TaxID=2172005 RepID=UPI00135806A7|nr:hypothetical protein [Methylosinus sp. Ce-a6]